MQNHLSIDGTKAPPPYLNLVQDADVQTLRFYFASTSQSIRRYPFGDQVAAETRTTGVQHKATAPMANPSINLDATRFPRSVLRYLLTFFYRRPPRSIGLAFYAALIV